MVEKFGKLFKQKTGEMKRLERTAAVLQCFVTKSCVKQPANIEQKGEDRGPQKEPARTAGKKNSC